MKTTPHPPRLSLPTAKPVSRRLALRPHAFLNQWLHLDRPSLVMRGAGFSLNMATEFGVFFDVPDGDSASHPVLEDPVSGLRLDPAELAGIYWLDDGTAPPLLELEFRRAGFACALQPREDEASRQVLSRMIRSFAGPEVSAAALRAAGAGAWLDQWEGRREDGRAKCHLREVGGPDRLEVSIRGSGFSLGHTLETVSRDRDADTHRFVDRGRGTAVFVDFSHAGIGYETDGRNHPGDLVSAAASHHRLGRPF